MTTATMTKRQLATRIDSAVVDALSQAAEDKGISIAKYLERLLIHELTTAGKLPMGFKVSKSNWGGKRQPLNSEVKAPREALVGEELPLPVGSTERSLL